MKAIHITEDLDVPITYFDWDTSPEQLKQRIPDADYLDFVTLIRHRFQVAVDDTGMIKAIESDTPMVPNLRASELLHTFGYPGEVYGDAVVIGVTGEGFEADVPDEVVQWAENRGMEP